MKGLRNRWRIIRAAGLVMLLNAVYISLASLPVYAQTGTVLADFIPGGATGNGRGMAFDGVNLYYTITGNTNIYKVTTTGTLLATIPVAQTQGTIQGGPLAWDGSALWTMNYGSNSFTLYRVNPANGAILSSCNIATQNPAHLAVTSSPRNIGEFPDGLDWSGSTLWVSSEIFTGNWVVEVDTSCKILKAFNPPANQGTGAGLLGGTSGIAFVGGELWHPTPTNNITAMLIFQTNTSGALTALSFVASRLIEDLAFDSVTFAPKCALWGNEATFGSNHLTAYQVPCADTTPPVIVPTITPAPNAAGWNNTSVTVSWSVSDPESGIVSSSGCGPTTLTTETAGTTLTCSATNGAGLSNSVSVTVKIDKTPPNITGSRSPPPNAAGWNNTDVTVTFACSDALSGIASCGPTPQVVSTDGAGQSRTGTAVDRAGNSASLTVSGINIDKTPPVANSQSVKTAEDTAIAITLTGSDTGSGVSSFTLVTLPPPSTGSLTGTPPNLTYTPPLAFNKFFINGAPVTFTFKVTDVAGNTSAPATVFITVTEVNDPPVANPDSKLAGEDTPLSFPASDLTANDKPGRPEATDEVGQTLTVTAVSAASAKGGTVSLSSGSVTYKGAKDFVGQDSFTYTVCDNGTTNGVLDSKCATGTVNVTVVPFITTVAGTGGPCSIPTDPCGDGHAATNAQLSKTPYGIAMDKDGNLYIADLQIHRVRRVDAITKNITTVAGTGVAGFNMKFNADGTEIPKLATDAQLNSPAAVAARGVDLYIADLGNMRIRKVTGPITETSTGNITTIAGNGQNYFSGDGGPATKAALWNPQGVAVDTNGNAFIADTINNRIRRVDAATNIINTVAGTTLVSVVDGVTVNITSGYNGDNILATDALLNNPTGVAVDGAGNFYIAEQGNHMIRKVDASTKIITRVAGFVDPVTGKPTSGFSGDGGPATNARLDSPSGVASDVAGNLLIADFNNHAVRRVDAFTKIITRVAGFVDPVTGKPTSGFSGDNGPATDAKLKSPYGVALTPNDDDFLISDQGNSRVRGVGLGP